MKEEFDDTKGVIRIRISKKNTQHNGQKKKNKMINNNLQNFTQKTKYRVTRTPLKTGGELRCSGKVSSGTHHVNLISNSVTSHEITGTLSDDLFQGSECTFRFEQSVDVAIKTNMTIQNVQDAKTYTTYKCTHSWQQILSHPRKHPVSLFYLEKLCFCDQSVLKKKIVKGNFFFCRQIFSNNIHSSWI